MCSDFSGIISASRQTEAPTQIALNACPVRERSRTFNSSDPPCAEVGCLVCALQTGGRRIMAEQLVALGSSCSHYLCP